MSREENAAVKKALQEWNTPTAERTPNKKTVGQRQREQQLHFLSLYEQLPLFEMEGAATNERERFTRYESQS
jgi:hypothetical protein